MKKIKFISIAAIAFLAIASVCAYLLGYTNADISFYIAIGAFILLISGVLAAFARKRIVLNIVCSSMSAMSFGFLLRGWYLYRGFNNPLWLMLIVAILAVGYLWVFFALAHIKAFKKRPKLFSILFVIISLAIYVTLVFTTKTTFISTLGFYCALTLAFIFAICKSAADTRELLRAFTLSTYSLFAVALLIALAAIFDGDIDFDLDFSLDLSDGAEVGLEVTGEVIEGVIDAKRSKRIR